MKLSKTLWCVSFIVIAVFLMPVFAETPVGQLDSMDDINDINPPPNTKWDDYWLSSYMLQTPPGDANLLGWKDPNGSMKIDFTRYPGTSPYTGQDLCKPQRTFSPVLDVNYQNQAITLWVWSADANDSRPPTLSSRLNEIVLFDSTYPVGSGRNTGSFTVPSLKNNGWNKVIAPFRNFRWTAGGLYMNPEDVVWNQITRIRLTATCSGDPCGSAIYMDDLRLELAPNTPAMPYQMASFDDINDEDWRDGRGTGLMLQSPPGGEVNEGTGSMMIDFINRATGNWDIDPVMALIPALDFTAVKDWAITVWVWTDLVNDSTLHEIIIYDNAGHMGRFRVPWAAIAGWQKVTANLDEFIWNLFGSDQVMISPDDVSLDAITAISLWTSCYTVPGNNIYLDDLRVEESADALSEAKVHNADYGTITVDGNAADWETLVDSDILDFDLQAVPDPNGNLHVKYRLAWDADYLYILVQEEPGDGVATEAASLIDFKLTGADYWYDNLSLFFDFTNNRLPGEGVHISLWLFLGLSSTGQTDLMMAWINGRWSVHDPVAVANGSVATSGTLGSRVIEAKVSWSDLDSAINEWLLPEGGLAAAVTVKPGSGYIFGCDPRLIDTEEEDPPWNDEKGSAWLARRPLLRGGNQVPTGRDIYSTDVRLVWSAGDLDYDCDVDFVDLQVLVENWLDDGCNNLNDFCNGADIIINGEVNFVDYAQLALRWLE